jgi:hypothetical protein
MMSSRYPPRHVLVAIMLSFSLPVFGQELKVQEVDDFINPNALVIHHGIGEPLPVDFLVSRVYGGFNYNYLYRTDRPPTDVGFLRCSNDLYYTWFGVGFQTDLKITGFFNFGSNEIATFQGRLQEAVYISPSSSVSSSNGLRCQISWDFQRMPTPGFTNALSIGVQTAATLPFSDLYAMGGFFFTWKPSEDSHLFTATAQVPVMSWMNGSNVRIGFGASVDNFDFSKTFFKNRNNVTVLAAIIGQVDFNSIESILHLVYLPSYNSETKSWNHQVGIYLDVPLLAEIFGQ